MGIYADLQENENSNMLNLNQMYTALYDLPEVRSAEIRDRMLWVYLNNIDSHSIRDESDEVLTLEDVVVKINGRHMFITGPIPESDNYEGNSCHPNIGSEGDLCYGTEMGIQEALKMYQIPLAVVSACEFLRQYNPSDMYWRQLRRDPCESCGGDIDCTLCYCNNCPNHDTRECGQCGDMRRVNFDLALERIDDRKEQVENRNTMYQVLRIMDALSGDLMRYNDVQMKEYFLDRLNNTDRLGRVSERGINDIVREMSA